LLSRVERPTELFSFHRPVEEIQKLAVARWSLAFDEPTAPYLLEEVWETPPPESLTPWVPK
jgi:hypothetical protein